MERPWCLLASIGLACSPPLTEISSAGSSGGSNSTATAPSSSTSPTAGAVDDTAGTAGTAGADGAAEGTTGNDDSDESTGAPPVDGPTYDQVRQKSSDDCYQRDEALVDQLAYHRIRSLEFDLHVGGGGDAVNGDWLVRGGGLQGDTSCRLISDCLAEVRAFAQAVPKHEVITVWLDLENDWNASHSIQDLDAILQAELGDALFGPQQLRDTCDSTDELASIVTDPSCGWPSLGSLRGRVIAAITANGQDGIDDQLSDYLAEGTHAFVAPEIDEPAALTTASPSYVFYNIRRQQLDTTMAVEEAGFVVRTWEANNVSDWKETVEAGAHHVATVRTSMHDHPWTTTHDAEGWPFECKGPCESTGPEPGTIIGIVADSNDISGTSDNMMFLHQDLTDSPNGDWTALVSTPSSSVAEFAKGCVMARAGLEPEAAYFAVCRPADNRPIRAQSRDEPGAGTVNNSTDVAPPNTVDQTSVAWVHLAVHSEGRCATGYAGWHRGDWVELDTQCFDEPLVYQGLAASSLGSPPVKFLFVDPRHDDASVDTSAFVADDVGSSNGTCFDGPLPP
ncbi:MAG: hypothetical protein AAGF11_21205 [Myxococcota bacterium]